MAPDSLIASSRCDAIIESADGGRRSVIPPRMRALAFKRARWRCEAPNCTRHRLLEVHHRNLVAVGGINRLDNLIVLCWHCHRKLHDTADAATEALRNAPG
jgi:5-methylcytosine-specific restriction endonuclease McrA